MVGSVGGGAASDSDAGSAGAEPADPPVVDCESRTQIIPSRRRPGHIPRSVRRRSVIAGPVLFSGAKAWGDRRSKLSRAIKPRRKLGGRLQPAKIPILVKARRTVTVSALPPPGRRALVAVGNAEGRPLVVRGETVELRACPRRAKVAGRRVGRRTPFTGGFRLDGRMCLRVEVRVEGRQKPIRRRIRFGPRARCRRALAGRLLVQPPTQQPGETIRIAVKNTGRVGMLYTSCNRVQRLTEGGWRDATEEVFGTKHPACVDIGLIARPGETRSHRLDRIPLPHGLEPDTYRVRKRVTAHRRNARSGPRGLGLTGRFEVESPGA